MTRNRTDPTGRLDVAAVRTLEGLLRTHLPEVRDVLFDGGNFERDFRAAMAKVLGPRIPRLRTVRRAVKQVAPLMGAALKDARRLNR